MDKKDIIEHFLSHGLPVAPESRATKIDLERAIRERDLILETVRGVLLEVIAAKFTQIEKQERRFTVDVVFHKEGKDVVNLLNKFSTDRLIQITRSNNGTYAVFYKRWDTDK